VSMPPNTAVAIAQWRTSAIAQSGNLSAVSLETPSRRGARLPTSEPASAAYAALGSRSSARSVIVTPSAVATSQILAKLAERYPLDS